MKKCYFYLLILIFSFKCLVIAQVEEQDIDILSWLPNGDYENIERSDLWVGKSKSKGYEQFRMIMDKQVKKRMRDMPLPNAFLRTLRGFTLSRLSGYSNLSIEELEERSKPENKIGSEQSLSPITIAFRTENGKRVFRKLHHETSCLWIFNFSDDIAGVVERSRKSGILSLEQKYRKQPIYSFSARSGGRFFISPTHTNLLLVTREMKNIERMIQSGLGEEESILESSVWIESINSMNNHGTNWMISDISLRARIQLEEEVKLNAPQERISYLEKQLEENGIQEQHYIEFGKTIIHRQVVLYRDEKFAKRAMENTSSSIKGQIEKSQSMKGASRDLTRSTFSNMKCEVDGKYLVISRYMEEEYLKLVQAEALRRSKLKSKQEKKKARGK